MSSKKKRTITVEIEDAETLDSLIKKVRIEAEKEMALHKIKKGFMVKVESRISDFRHSKNRVVDNLVDHIILTGSYRGLLGVAQLNQRRITEELDTHPKETQEYILETTDVFYPLQYHDTKKGALREVLKEVAERIEQLEEKDL